MTSLLHTHKTSHHSNNQIVPALVGIGGMLVITALMLAVINLIGQNNIQTFIASAGIWAPVAFILLRVSRVIFPPVGGPPFILLAGTLFGFVAGSFYAIIADCIAYFLNYTIAQKLGRSFLTKLLGKAGVEKLEHISSTILHDQPFLLAFVLITDTFDIAEYAVGLTNIRLSTVLQAIFMCTVTTIPATLYLGYLAGSNQPLLFTALSFVAFIGLIPIIFQRNLQLFFDRFKTQSV